MDRHMGLLAEALRVVPKLVGAECGWQQTSGTNSSPLRIGPRKRRFLLVLLATTIFRDEMLVLGRIITGNVWKSSNFSNFEVVGESKYLTNIQ